jgi:cell division protein FtsB
MRARRARPPRTLPAAGDPFLLGAAVPRPRRTPARPRRQPTGTPAAGAVPALRSVLGLRLPVPAPARRPRWPRVLVAVVALYAGSMAAVDAMRLAALDRQLAAVDAQLEAVTSREAMLRMQAAALQDPAAIADAARRWLGLAAPGDVVFTPVSPGH